MNKNMGILKKGIIFVCATLIAVSTAYAGSFFSSTTVKSVSVLDVDQLLVTLDGPITHSETCASPGREQQLIINPASKYGKEMYATAITAVAGGKKVYGWVNKCILLYGLNFPVMTSIYLGHQ